MRACLDPPTLCLLAEAIFAYVDELSAESVEGYTQGQASVAGERERRRWRLLLVLASPSPPDETVARQAAREAGWSAPTELAALACSPDELERIPPRLAALRALDAGFLRGSGLIHAEEHLVALAVHQGEEPVSELTRRRLSPLDPLRPSARERTIETLDAWLAHPGHPKAMAQQLHLHPQTVHYRLGQLRDLFGDSLEDPHARLELGLAVRYRRLALDAEAEAGGTSPEA